MNSSRHRQPREPKDEHGGPHKSQIRGGATDNHSLELKTPRWNESDIRLIRTGVAKTSNCSDSDEARVFLANRILSRIDRTSNADPLTPIPFAKWRVKRFLQSQEYLLESY